MVVITPEELATKRAKNAAYMREYYKKNRQSIRDNNQKSKAKNGHKWASENDPVKRREYADRHNEKRRTDPRYKARIKTEKKRYSDARKEEAADLVASDWKAWMGSCKTKEEYNEQRRGYWRANRENLNTKKAAARNRLKMSVLERYGGCCSCCGEDNFGFLTIDHKNGDGGKRRAAGEWKGIALYRQIEKNGFPDDMQILCWNCNIAKHIYGKCPHQLVAERVIISGIQKVA